LNLLLAEDNLPDALLVQEAIDLEKLPLKIHIAPDGEKAVDFITRAESDPQAPFPDILLLDLNLPKIEGLDVLRRIRSGAACRAIPVLVFTSSDSPEDKSRVAELKAGYFRKPVSYTEFLKVGGLIRKLLEERGMI
jgi:CheY-like chemotaxis protein